MAAARPAPRERSHALPSDDRSTGRARRTAAPPRPQLRAVPSNARDARSRLRDRAKSPAVVRVLGVVVAGAAAFAVAVLLVLGIQVVMLQRQQSLDQLTERRTAELERYQALLIEVTEVEDPASVLARAQRELGMVPAPDVLYLVPNTVPFHPAFERTLPTTPATSPSETDSVTAPASESPESSSSSTNGGTTESD
jgi:cell division protein FtsB